MSVATGHCEECGFDYGSLGRPALPAAVREPVEAYRGWLAQDLGRLRRRPAAEVWSPLEYAAHVRHVLAVQRGRVLQAQVEDQPAFVPMRRDEVVTEQRYNAQDPAAVAEELAVAAEELAVTLESLDAAGWARTGIYNWPTTAVRTVEWVAVNTVHELRHHLADIARGMDAPPA